MITDSSHMSTPQGVWDGLLEEPQTVSWTLFLQRHDQQFTWSFSAPVAGGHCSLRASLSFAARLDQV